MYLEFGPIPASLAQFEPELAVVLGSGLAAFADSFEAEFRFPYSTIDNLPIPRVPGHTGEMVGALCSGKRVLFAVGRSHLYEGHDPRDITALVRLTHQLGISRIVLTNAAGSINPDFVPGHWMALTDHLNLTGVSPLTGGPHFIDCSEVYSASLREKFVAAAVESGLPLHEGVYAAVLGPQYETPAEVRMLAALGADAVGMSTVLEALQATALGMETLALSCLTNWACGVKGSKPDHQEVVDAAGTAVAPLRTIFEKFTARI